MDLAGFHVFYSQIEIGRKLKALQGSEVINFRLLSSVTYIQVSICAIVVDAHIFVCIWSCNVRYS